MMILKNIIKLNYREKNENIKRKDLIVDLEVFKFRMLLLYVQSIKGKLYHLILLMMEDQY